jgi:hypothetical protein
MANTGAAYMEVDSSGEEVCSKRNGKWRMEQQKDKGDRRMKVDSP